MAKKNQRLVKPKGVPWTTQDDRSSPKNPDDPNIFDAKMRRRGGHFEAKIGGHWRRLTKVPFDPENPSPEARAASPQIGEDPGPEWVTMRDARAVTGLDADGVLAIANVGTQKVGRDHLVNWPSLRDAIAAALTHVRLYPPSPKA